MTKVVFMGTPQFAVPILEGLVKSGVEISFVVTQPDRPVGRKKVLTPPPVKVCAEKNGLRVLQPELISKSEELEILMQTEFDLIITAAFGQFLPEKLLHHAKVGAINVHASLLPKYRGGAPVHYAIMNGDEEIGVTIMEMVKQMDAGDMLASRSIPITDSDDVGVMFEKLSLLGRNLLLEILEDYLAGKIQGIAQDETKVSFSPNITREQEVIDWSKSARSVFNQIRGLHPFPVAHTTWEEKRLKIYKATLPVAQATGEVGEVVKREKNSLWIIAGDQQVVALEEVQLAGKSKMNIQEFLNGVGQKIKIGDKLG
ncbi:methionyl-tRNA formyltransferase [Pilibacter termitis]|uniref:Methionyl-tRNA formyltransferase n=1 Tax=Pilibacter termitis TaxID=263852 RepID=A0A1T4PYU4_9ENTE|nr:methionyl-tRNA formyltransferase [Pilibacter termitis]SJZ96138.1 methionyl-tRNA formyltransferase [Pilibacter termitis]